MTNLPVGTMVRIGSGKKAVFGRTMTAPMETPLGKSVTVDYLPDFRHLSVTGASDHLVAELVEVRVCACASLSYRPQHGDSKGTLFTTGCDYSRMPGRNSKFLPGHDAKAKGFLIKASGLTNRMENGKSALETAADLGDKISLAVAKGMDNERQKLLKNSRSKMWRNVKDQDVRPATREDQLTDAQRLQRQLGVTDAMIKSLSRGIVNDLPGYEGAIGGPTGTVVAVQERKLASWGRITDLGCQVMNQPPTAELWGDRVVCKNEEGSFTTHTGHGECRRCGAERDYS